MDEESFAETVDKVNGRLIRRLGLGGCYGWTVEKRGPKFGDRQLQVWIKRETLAAARD